MSPTEQPDLVEAPGILHIPAGSFVMGSSDRQIALFLQNDAMARKWQENNYFRREQPQHTLTLAGYSIGRYPVTVGAYREFVSAGGYLRREYWTAAGWSWCERVGRTQPAFWSEKKWTANPRLPVVGVSWYEAMAYCHWLSEESGRRYRLPSEAEWEKAARGGDGRIFPWGDDFDPRRCNTRETGLSQSEPVGRRSPAGESPYGCAEMAGNVSEWTLSRYRPYPYNGQDGRNGEDGDAERVIRGGSWFKPSLRARVTARGMNDPFFADHDVGFRYVLEG